MSNSNCSTLAAVAMAAVCTAVLVGSPRTGLAQGREDWAQTHRIERDGPEAELLVQLGDIDNLGFGWPDGFDPFTGRATPPHPFPWTPEDGDPDGTDRIMVISGYRAAGGDGYTASSARPANAPQALQLKFDLDDVVVKSAAIQLFVDDFQAPVWRHRFTARLDGRDAPDLSLPLNALNQTGPIGKLLTFQLLPEYLPLLDDGSLQIEIDDTRTDAAEGFAFDFVRLLINPKPWRYTGTVRGIAVRAVDGAPVAGVLVTAGNIRQAVTAADGRFELDGVPAGLVVTSGSHPDYVSDSEPADLEVDGVADVVLELATAAGSVAALDARLDQEGRIDLYGIYFATDEATLQPASETTLQAVHTLLVERPSRRLVIAGHTDAEGSQEHNLDLSERRAAAVVAWLVERDIDAARLQSEGLGESRPVADNATSSGRALNRRVEIRNATP